MAIQVIRQLVTELMQKTRSSLLWHYVLLTLQGKEIKHSFWLQQRSQLLRGNKNKTLAKLGFHCPAWLHPCFRCSFNSGFFTHEHHHNCHHSAPSTPASLPTFFSPPGKISFFLGLLPGTEHPPRASAYPKASTAKSLQGAQRSQACKMEESPFTTLDTYWYW